MNLFVFTPLSEADKIQSQIDSVHCYQGDVQGVYD